MDTSHYMLYGPINQGELINVGHHMLGHLNTADPDDYGTDNSPKHHVIHINSPGGDLHEALSTINLLKSVSAPITTVINIGAESAALLVAMMGDRRIVLPNSYGMAHGMSTETGGTIQSMKDDIANAEAIEAAVLDLYLQYSRLDEFFVRKNLLVSRSFFMSAFDLVRYGLADEIVQPQDLQKVLSDYGSIKKKKI